LRITNVKDNLEDGVILVSDEIFISIATFLSDNNCFPQTTAQQSEQADVLTCVSCNKPIEDKEVYCYECYAE